MVVLPTWVRNLLADGAVSKGILRIFIDFSFISGAGVLTFRISVEFCFLIDRGKLISFRFLAVSGVLRSYSEFNLLLESRRIYLFLPGSGPFISIKSHMVELLGEEGVFIAINSCNL